MFSLHLMCMHRPHYTLRINIGYTLYTVELLKNDHPFCMKDSVNHSAILLIKNNKIDNEMLQHDNKNNNEMFHNKNNNEMFHNVTVNT